MLKINQQTKNSDPAYNTITKIEPFEININKETLERDINRVEQQLKLAKKKENINNLRYILKQLLKFKHKIKDDKIELCWNLNDGKLVSYPTEFKVYSEYKVDTSEYIELKHEKMLILDYIDIINIMSFEFIYRDLGYSHQDIEDLFDSLGITGTVSPKVCIEFFKEELLNPYDFSKSAKIEDSPYINKESHKIKDYYNTKEFKTKTYGDTAASYFEVVRSSVKDTLDIIVTELFRQIIKYDEYAKLVSIGETTVIFIVDENADIKLEDLTSCISVRIFGRNFEAIPKITVL